MFDPSQETFEEYLRRISIGPSSWIPSDCKESPGTVFLIHGKKETIKAPNLVEVPEGGGPLVGKRRAQKYKTKYTTLWEAAKDFIKTKLFRKITRSIKKQMVAKYGEEYFDNFINPKAKGVTLIHEMQKRKAKKGLATLCIGGGMGIAMRIETNF